MLDVETALSSTLRSELQIFSEDELAHVLVIKSQTLATWRAESRGPDYVKLGKSIFYRKQDVVTWINESVVLTRRAT
jgi:hypothetical protein